MQILAQWRDDISTAVQKGETYKEYLSTFIPSPKTDSKIMAMQLIYFEKIDSKSLHPASVQNKTKDEKGAGITHQIVLSTIIAEPIAVTLHPPTLLPDAESSDDSSKISKSSYGTVVKEGINK